MTLQCTFTKPNGQQCRAKALWGSDPPRCVAHRQDGGPAPPLFQKDNQCARLRATHGFYSDPLLPRQSPVDQTAEILLKHERLTTLIASQPSRPLLTHLYRLYGQNLDRLLALLQDYHRRTGHHPDRLLRLANGPPRARLQATFRQLRHNIKRQQASTYPTTRTRSPRYWLLYNYLLTYVRRHRRSPTREQLKQACRISSNHVLEYWLARLQQDGLIRRLPRRARNIHLPGHSPVQLELPFPADDSPEITA